MLDWHFGTRVMTVIVTPVFMLADGKVLGWLLGSMQLAVRPEIRRRKCGPFPRLMVSMELIHRGRTYLPTLLSLTMFTLQDQAIKSSLASPRC
jgi:hypothetical protein